MPEHIACVQFLHEISKFFAYSKKTLDNTTFEVLNGGAWVTLDCTLGLSMRVACAFCQNYVTHALQLYQGP